MKDKTRIVIIDLFGFLLVFSALFWLLMPLSRFSVYESMFDYLNSTQIVMRYILSLSGRILGLVVGIGIVYRQELFRKLGIFLCLTTVISAYGKHPEILFSIAVQNIQNIVRIPNYLSNAETAEMARFLMITGDLVFAIGFIVYFTRPSVKNLFSR